jgi:hypothetical protein
MANDISTPIIHFRKRPMTPAERARNYRLRKKAKANGGTLPVPPPPVLTSAVTMSRPGEPITLCVTPSRSFGSISLILASFALAAVGIVMNGWFAKSLGSSDLAGWLFLAIGVASDFVALSVPAYAAQLWRGSRRLTSLAGWGVWAMTFVFAVTAGIGFASLNIADVTQARASRVTPAVTVAQAELTDAMGARDRECHGGVGKFCREREAAVADRRQALDLAMHQVIADPQTQAAIHIVAWLSRGILNPTEDDFAMLRLCLLAMLPQIGGVLLMIGRAK